jgi:hemoglobin-like flavoprotein
MTQKQIALVKSSFAKITPIADTAAELFYARLFQIAPYTRPLFKGNLEEQGNKLMQMIAVAVYNLDRLEEITPALQKLGRDHRTYGVTDGHYDIVASALIWTLEKGLAADFTDEVRSAWVAMYTAVADIMKRAAHAVHQAA